jgi:excisionase family DNA binding protein
MHKRVPAEKRDGFGNKSPATESSQLLFTVLETARILRVSRSTLYEAIARGQINVTRFGAATRIQRSEVERLAREGLVRNRGKGLAH